jgi:glycosyltransferase 2 family protein
VKNSLSLLLRISIAAALLIFLFLKTDTRVLVQVLARADFALMVAAFVLFVLLNVLVCWRWDILLKGQEIRVPFGRLLASYFSSLFFNLVLPSTIGGDAVRTLDISRHTNRHSSNILASVILDRVSGFFGLFTVLIFSLFFGFRTFGDRNILVATFFLLALVVFFSVAMFHNHFFRALVKHLPFHKLKEYLIRIHEATSGYSKRKQFLAAAWGLSLLTHVGLAFVFYISALALGIHLKVIYFLIFVPMVNAFASLPFSIGGLGLRDSACVYVFGKVGLVSAQALALSLANFGFMLGMGLIGGISYVASLYGRRV